MTNIIRKHKLWGGKGVLVDGVVQSLWPAPEGTYFNDFVKHMRAEPGEPLSVLMLGVGTGSMARKLRERHPNMTVVGVDNSPEMWQLFYEQNKDYREWMVPVEMDAFDWVETENRRTQRTFNLIIVDLADGCWIPFRTVEPYFINKLRSWLRKKGQIFVNAPDYLSIAKQSRVSHSIAIGSNLLLEFKK